MDPLPIVRHLSEGIGIRFFATPAEHEAARYIAEQFASRGLDVEMEPFRCMGWELLEPCEAALTAPVCEVLDAYPMVHSLATPDEGLSGTLRHAGKCPILGVLMWDRFELVDAAGDVVAWVIVRETGPAGTMPADQEAAAMPMVVIGQPDGERIIAWLDAGERVDVELSIHAEFRPGALSHNVIAEQRGSHPDEGTVVVCGHYDTQYNSPGAIDNASGIAGVLDLAERLGDAAPRRSIRYIAFGAEEPMMVGSSYHVRRLIDRGELRSCVANICLDMIACNAPTWIWATDGERRIKDRADRVAAEIDLAGKYGELEWVVPPWGTSDHYPFQLHGIGVLCCTWHGDTWPHTHLPSDTIEQLNLGVYHDTLALVEPVLRDLSRAIG